MRLEEAPRAISKAIQEVNKHLQPQPITPLSNLLKGLAATVRRSDSSGSNPPASVIASEVLVECWP
jgi:uncharacterized protein (UPF0216 family)